MLGSVLTVEISTGYKFISENGFVAKIYLGFRKKFFKNSTNFYNNDIIVRGGISLGHRF